MDPAGYDYYHHRHGVFHTATSSPPLDVAEACRVVGCWFNSEKEISTQLGFGHKFEIKYTHEGSIVATGFHLFLPEGLQANTGHFSPVIDGVDVVIPLAARLFIASSGSQVAASACSFCLVVEPY